MASVANPLLICLFELGQFPLIESLLWFGIEGLFYISPSLSQMIHARSVCLIKLFKKLKKPLSGDTVLSRLDLENKTRKEDFTPY